MDPNEALNRIREELELSDNDVLVEVFNALDNWLTRGGFLPTEWERKKPSITFTTPVVVDECHELMQGGIWPAVKEEFLEQTQLKVSGKNATNSLGPEGSGPKCKCKKG